MILGAWPGREGLFVATGHEGDGIAMAPVTGRLLSAMVGGLSPDRKVRELGPERVAVGGAL